MPIDASIYRGIQQPQAPDQMAQYGRMMQIRNMMDQGELAGLQRTALADDLAEQRSVKDYMSRADMTKPDMVIADVTKISPKTGWKMRQDFLAQQKDQSVIDENRSKMTQRDWQLQRDRTDYLMQQFSPVLMKYNELVRGGATPEQALATVQPQYAMARGGMVNSGMFPAQAVSGLPEQFDPAFVHNNLMATLKFKDQLENQRADQKASTEQANQYLIPDGKGGYKVNETYVQARGQVAAQGRPQVNVNTDRTFFGEIANKLGGQVAATVEQAQGAVQTIGTVNRVRQALDSGNINVGPTATAAQVLGQVGNVLGINGQTADERLVNTRQAMQGLAQLELNAAGQMKGQGAITEPEREIIRRAAAGEIQNMTVSELRMLMDTLDKTARFKIRQNAANVERMKGTPQAGQMVQFMQVDMPPEYTPPQRPAQPAQPTQQPAAQPVFSAQLPDPAQNSGKILTDTTTGQKYKSDGKQWQKIAQ